MRSALVLALVVAPNGSAAVSESLVDGWPSADAVGALAGQVVRFPSQSPFSLRDVGADAPAIEAVGHLFLPADASPAAPVPAVVLIHGAGGVLFRREPLYARQLAAMGIAALIVDAFRRPRRYGAGLHRAADPDHRDDADRRCLRGAPLPRRSAGGRW